MTKAEFNSLYDSLCYGHDADLTGHHEPVLHIHYYNKKFDRTDADYLDKVTFEKYKKYMKGREWYD